MKMTYEEAKKELEEILSNMQQDLISLDDLSKNVTRAAELIAFCKEKLRNTEEEMQKMIEEE